MTKTVTLVEFTAFERITPLAAGYLWSYAANDPEVADAFSFRIYDAPASSVDREAAAAELEREPSDVYAFSCYVWNMGLMTWLLERLADRLPNAHFILGGPQVMSHAAQYVPPDRSNVLVCNGEGERTFHQYLRQLMSDEPDFAAVPGLSFWRDGELVTTEPAERIKDLTEIPSPYTNGVFEPGKYTYAILETNRGCPYNCGFCFWGAATNAKVNRFETDRILQDIDWISDNEFMMLYIADANWGISPRDVEITKHVVHNRERTGYPLMMGMNSAKNKPERMAEITKLLIDGGMLTSQPISLQTMDKDVLRLIDRSNIRAETYTELHRHLREQKISSFTEMIWPLPGETVASYRRGLTELCRSRADTILVYLQLLLHNTPIYKNRELFGIKVRRVPDAAAEADVVVGTKWVSEEDYDEGVWLFYSMQSLYCLRGLYYLANHLDRTGRMDFDELFARAVDYFKRHQDSSEICRFFADSVANLGNYHLLNSGTHTHMLLHANRAEFDRLLAGFVAEQKFWTDPVARAAFELDLLARPYVYREKPRLPDHTFTELEVTLQDRGIQITAPQAVTDLLRDLEPMDDIPDGPLFMRHPLRRKLPFREDQPLHDNVSYCQGMTVHLREMLPEYKPVPALAH
ncbi:radical SAM protein [Kibdelosporangium persicum]|uniref:Radical SAM domain-containing protein n=1 Tax=Kibdelosporangium persicum TaxID=2698649 RepID=A0ABX2FIY3_9PSEU|nr:radical SAM protein [Kibdelosporangium persicum]NRN71084.1 Radical SAM domain-containing protein [Kibdelosporangium persicum]